MKLIIAILNIAIIWSGLLILRNAAISILRGNCSKSKCKKILQAQSALNKMKLDFIIPNAGVYEKQARKIIFFAKLYFGIFVIDTAISIILLIINIPLEVWILYLLIDLILFLPVLIFLFSKTYWGWSKKGKGKMWKYEANKKSQKIVY